MKILYPFNAPDFETFANQKKPQDPTKTACVGAQPYETDTPGVYYSDSKGPIRVSDMAFKHLVNAKKLLARNWARLCVMMDRNMAHSALKNLGGDVKESFDTPGDLFPVYDNICEELEARALKHALEDAKGEKDPAS